MDWGEIEMEYVTGDCSYSDLAERHGVTTAAVASHACPGKWRDKRSEYRAKLMDEARKNAAEAQGRTFVVLCETHERISRAAKRIAEDADQFYRYIIKGRDKTFEKADAQALRAVVAALSELTEIYTRLYGTASEAQGGATGVIVLPDADIESEGGCEHGGN